MMHIASKKMEFVTPTKKIEWWYALFAVVGTFVFSVVAVSLAIAESNIEFIYIALLLFFLLLTGFGVGTGLHRYFTHKAFTAARPLQIIMAVLGIASGQGFFFRWVYDHRMHHRSTDVPGDPHSPYWDADISLSGWRGLLHAHCLWLFRWRCPVEPHIVRELCNDPLMVRLNYYSPLITMAGLVLPGLLAALILGPSWLVIAKGILWGGFVRMFLLNHITWGVNSFGHRYGQQAVDSTNQARNNFLLGFLALGDGWHANHHLSPRSARHGWKWYEFDFNWVILLVLRRCGLVWDIVEPQSKKFAGKSSQTRT